MEYVRGILGLAILVGIAFAFSPNKKIVDWRLVGTGILLQLVFGLLIAKVSFVQSIFATIINQCSSRVDSRQRE